MPDFPMRHLPLLLSLALVACATDGTGTADVSNAEGVSDSTDQPANTAGSPASLDGQVVLERVASEEATFRVVRLLDGLENAWAVDWLPDGRMLITERPGRMLLVDD